MLAHRVAAPQALLSCTVGGRNKIEPDYPYPYREIIPEFLRRTRGTHLHIGSLSGRTVNAIRRQLCSLGIPPERFEIATRVRDVWAKLVDRGVDVYLCSFPYGGARAGIEAMGAGIPIIAHVHCRSDFLGAADATYPGSFRWRTPAELWDIVAELSPDVLARHARLSRTHYETFHREDILSEFLARRTSPDRFGSRPPLCLQRHRQRRNRYRLASATSANCVHLVRSRGSCGRRDCSGSLRRTRRAARRAATSSRAFWFACNRRDCTCSRSWHDPRPRRAGRTPMERDRPLVVFVRIEMRDPRFSGSALR